MAIRRPFNLNQWINDNRDLLKPPVGNKNLYTEAGDYIVMIVGGPNARKDFHWNETEELFYQLEGDINVRIQEDGKPVDIPIKAGEMLTKDNLWVKRPGTGSIPAAQYDALLGRRAVRDLPADVHLALTDIG